MNYPKGVKAPIKSTKKDIVYGNRGMDLEEDLNTTNAYYRQIDKAYIYKKPTPIKITKVDYKKAKITEAFFASPSTTDYNGLWQGKYIDFEAKETKNKHSFPLKNIHPHQLEHMKHIIKHGGICFFIIRFTTRMETYLILACDLFELIDDEASVAYDKIKEKGYLLEEKWQPRIDYLKVIEEKFGGR